MKNKGRAKRWKRIIVACLAAGPLFLVATNGLILSQAQGKIYTNLSGIPEEPIGLVLGTSPRTHGQKNLFFERRMDAAAALFKAGKVKKLLVSGANSSAYYNEPNAMRKALVGRGVPERCIVSDFAGFRTLDSVVRAREVFGVQKCTIITDDFHLPRALYIASERNIEAIGYQTAPLAPSVSPKTYLRELGARSLVWIDLHLINRQPKFRGPKSDVLAAHTEPNGPI